jgi:hypothetical protein
MKIEIKRLAEVSKCSRQTVYQYLDQADIEPPLSLDEAVLFLESRKLFLDRDGDVDTDATEDFAAFVFIEGGKPADFRPHDIGQRLSRACGGVVSASLVNHLFETAERKAAANHLDDDWTTDADFTVPVATERALQKARANRGRPDVGVTIVKEWLSKIPADVWEAARAELDSARWITNA